ncbi:MAG: NAD-dependent epimerase/dehydratase family protein [Gammaproteobacteria bacterium]|nr:NAD-dependent epimerase/dehydratase family protein [Gammaproteobacteria bacterium]
MSEMTATQSPDKRPRTFVVAGAGYTGARVAERLAVRGPVFSLTRKAQTLKFAAPFDVIYLVPPPATGATDPRLERFLATLPANPGRIVYISTTGVYGDAGGATVTEDTTPAPATDRARRRLSAEAALRAWCEPRKIEWVILRAPGIYGPGRLPLDRLQRSEPALAESQAGPGNRIHVEDLADICVSALLKPEARNRIYNVGDGDHTTSTAFLVLVAKLAGLSPPLQLPLTQLQALKSNVVLSFLGESRCVDTTSLRQELGFHPRYPTAEAGIRASLPGAGSQVRRY